MEPERDQRGEGREVSKHSPTCPSGSRGLCLLMEGRGCSFRTYVGQPPVKVIGDTVAIPPGTLLRFGVHKTQWRVEHHPLVLLVDPAAADRAATVQMAVALGAHVAAAHDLAGCAPCTHVLVPATGEVVADAAVLTSFMTGRSPSTTSVGSHVVALGIRPLGFEGADVLRNEEQGTGRVANITSKHQAESWR